MTTVIHKLASEVSDGPPTLLWSLHTNLDGDLILRAKHQDGSAWVVLGIDADGRLFRYSGLLKSGLAVDGEGRIWDHTNE